MTVDDIITMMVEALENDEDVVQSDKTLSASPYGRQQYSNSWPVMNNYVDPNLIIKKLISPYGLQGKSKLLFELRGPSFRLSERLSAKKKKILMVAHIKKC